MKRGDMIQCADDPKISSRYMYSGVPNPGESLRNYTTGIPWRPGDIGIILDVQTESIGSNDWYYVYLKILSSSGSVGWIHKNWCENL